MIADQRLKSGHPPHLCRMEGAIYNRLMMSSLRSFPTVTSPRGAIPTLNDIITWNNGRHHCTRTRRALWFFPPRGRGFMTAASQCKCLNKPGAAAATSSEQEMYNIYRHSADEAGSEVKLVQIVFSLLLHTHCTLHIYTTRLRSLHRAGTRGGEGHE